MLILQNKTTNEIFKLKNTKEVNKFMRENWKLVENMRATITESGEKTEFAIEAISKLLGIRAASEKIQVRTPLNSKKEQK